MTRIARKYILKKDIISFLNHATMKYLEFPFAQIDYKMIVNDLKDFTAASYVVFNSFNQEKKALITEEISYEGGQLNDLTKILGTPILQKIWKLSDEDEQLLKSKQLMKIDNLYEVALHQIHSKRAGLIERVFNIGDTYTIGLYHDGSVLGNIIFFVEEGKRLQNQDGIELYAHQLSILLLRKNAEVKLSEKEAELQAANEEITAMNEELEASISQLMAIEEELRVNYEELLQKEQALQESEERWKFALEGSGVGVWDWNVATDEIHYSEKALEMFGYDSIEAFRVETTEERVHPEDVSFVKEAIKEHIQGRNQYYETVHRVRCKNGEYKWVLNRGKLISRTSEGKPLRMAGTYIDFNERKEFEAELLKQKQIMESIFEYAPDGIAHLNQGLEVIDVNRKFTEIFGYTREECLGKHIDDLIINEDIKLEAKRINEMATKNMKIELDAYRKTKDDRLIPVIIKGGPTILNGEIIGYHAIYMDVTERKKAEERIRYLSYHDELTGLFNRSFFEERLTVLDNEENLPISIIIGDVNGLKLTNDVFGHLEGDNLLKSMAAILKNCCHKESIISRWGGDEFAIILPKTNEEEVLSTCNEIIKVCSKTKVETIQISIALGCATKIASSVKVRDIIKEAEEMMYRHKLLESKSTRSQLIASLQASLFERSHETEAHATRMKELGMKLGRRIPLKDTELDELGLLTLLHDIGKIAIPDRILTKPEPLTEEEWEIMKKHPEVGYRIAESSKELFHIADCILYHHERWDGKGYPQGLKGEEIPKLARILSIIDAYDVMTNARIYKEPITKQEAIEEIKRCAGTQFDPIIAELFIMMMAE